MMKKKKICWITATYFLDVDLPVVPRLAKDFDIDWYVVSSVASSDSDNQYIRSQSEMPFISFIAQGYFFSPAHYRAMKQLVRLVSQKPYDWYYLDISDFLFLYPLVKKHLPLDRITVAAHNVAVPKGARYAPLARRSMKYILSNFRHFQVFSQNQESHLLSRCPEADVFYCPLMLKDYGKAPKIEKDAHTTQFLFFGNIVRYKRLDILLEAVKILRKRGVTGFKVNVCGYCRPEVWNKEYRPMIEEPEFVFTDIRRIPNEEVAALFALNDFFVMPYQDIAQSGAMAVALNYSLPIIASNLPTFHEFIEDGKNSWFFSQGDAEALADVMERAIRISDTDYEALRSNLRDMVKEKLSTDAIITRYRNYLDNKISHA